MISKRPVNASDAPQAAGGYAQALEVTDAKRLLFVSGQIPVRGRRQPCQRPLQSRRAWPGPMSDAQLRAAEMSFDNLVKVTIFLSDRSHALENRAIRQEVLGNRPVALTVIITGIFDAAWLLEIEAVAAA